jgi:hypothetical protein
MPRLQPERWTSLLIPFAVVSVMISILLWRAFADRPWLAVVAGLGAGVAFALLVTLMIVGHDTRLMVLREQNPDAVVVNVRRDPQLMRSLAAAREGVLDTTGVGWVFSMVVDRDGVTFYKGNGRPEPVIALPWSSIGAIEPGSVLARGEWGSSGYERLALVPSGESSGRIEFGVERLSPLTTSVGTMSEADLVQLAVRINEQRGLSSIASPSGALKGLESGPTAWSLTRLGPLPVSALGWVAQGIFLIGFVTVAVRGPLVVTLVTVAVSLALILLMFLRLRVAKTAAEREKAAGYTTLNGVNLAVEQRHPLTGVVIRAAGAPALSKQEFASLLGR